MKFLMKLTKTTKKGGCAAKISAQELKNILSSVDFPPPRSELKISGACFDDAAIYQISQTQSLVKTIDFFTPIVDSPSLFGQIAAANALSDVYAMGGKPLLALAVLAFPSAGIDKNIVTEIIQGAVNVLKKAGADLAGGHSIDDDSLKFGLSVTGIVDNDKILSNVGAKEGDKLILTKGLGTGSLMAALKNDFKKEADLADALDSMCMLNDIHACLDEGDFASINAATDVTGFGLAGHAYQMASASNVAIKIQASRLPKLEHVQETLSKENLTRAHRTNREYVQEELMVDEAISPVDQLIFFDPQTSGGLLLSVDAMKAEQLCTKLSKKFPRAYIIGAVDSKKEKTLLYEC